NTISTNGEASSRETIDELHFRIMRIGTVFTCPFERQAQKWLIKNLLESNFAFHRHEAADSMTVVFGIDPRRSRHIFDLTVLSVRRALLDERKLLPVSVYGLIGTRQKALVRYRHRLNEEDFSRLCFLMRGLAPSIIETGEYTLHEILYGAPGKEKPLFDRS